MSTYTYIPWSDLKHGKRFCTPVAYCSVQVTFLNICNIDSNGVKLLFCTVRADLTLRLRRRIQYDSNDASDMGLLKHTENF